jgi:DsbC/DsbD-like thiol-disulfide interchange protein
LRLPSAIVSEMPASLLRVTKILAAGAVFLLGFASHACAAPESHATIELIAPAGEPLQLRRPFSVGLLFHLDPGWHIYWRNAGDSGEPPAVQWILPQGFRAGALAWPLPMRLGHGSIVDYGYENQVLLVAPIAPPSQHNAGLTDSIQIAADVKYLICREICVPARTHVSLSMPISAEARQAARWRLLSAQTKSQIPKELPPGWKASARSQNTSFILSIYAPAYISRATFFPLDPNVIENAALQTFASAKAGFQLTLKKSDLLAKPVTALRGVIVLDGGRAYEIAAPVI